MKKVNKEDFLYNISGRVFEGKFDYLDTIVKIDIKTEQSNFDKNGELYIGQLNALFENLPLLLQQIATKNIDNAQFWNENNDENGSPDIAVEKLSKLLRVEHINLVPEREDDENPYRCWWYFELFIEVGENVFADHGLVVKLDKNLVILASDLG